MEKDPLTEKLTGAAIDVHRVLGPGLLESAYESCLSHELSLRDVSFRRQVPIGVRYKDVDLDCGYRADLIVGNSVIVEIKAVERLTNLHEAQILTYLRLADLPTGLLINFNTTVLKNGIRRFVV